MNKHLYLSHRPAWMRATLTSAALVFTLGACVPANTRDNAEVAAQLAAAGSIDDYVLVDCMLPGQLRQLGARMTYLTPRRAVKATRRDCGIRGGEYVLFDRSDYSNALTALLPKARAGDAVAQTYVGEIYEKGLGLAAPDHASAARWYRQAAEQGNTAAQTSLGALYERGLGVPQDKAMALDWYRKATGLTADRLIFESELKTQQAAFQREIALRNQVAARLQQQLRAAKQRTPPPPPPPTPTTRQTQTPDVRPATPAETVAAGTGPNPNELQRLMQSQQRDAQREAELREKALHAVQTIKESEASTQRDGAQRDGNKAAQAGKLELSLRQEINALQDASQRLAATN